MERPTLTDQCQDVKDSRVSERRNNLFSQSRKPSAGTLLAILIIVVVATLGVLTSPSVLAATCSPSSPCTIVAPYSNYAVGTLPVSSCSPTTSEWNSIATPNTGNGLTQEHSGGFVSHTTSSCTAGINIQMGFRSTTYTAGGTSDTVTAHWSFTGQLYAKTDCTPGGPVL